MEKKRKIKPIAFYLPQFHSIPENDAAYGEGFTEWTNVKKAKPLFEHHYQPRTPLNNNYYCLLDDGVMEKQAELAKQYGLYGFCYYHYWFKDGKKVLEKPLEMMLRNRKINIPFCLCWANENWTKRWDGGNNEIILEQDYDDKEQLKKHISYLISFFKDERYIKINNKPILIIYKPDQIPKLDEVIKIIRSEVRRHGFDGIVLISQHHSFYFNKKDLNLFDYHIQFQPLFSYVDSLNRKWSLKNFIKKMLIKMKLVNILGYTRNKINSTRQEKLKVVSYDDVWNSILNYKVHDKKLIAGAFVDWDNTPRRKNGTCFYGSNPEKYKYYMKQLIKKINNEYASDLLFINAWNEWGESAYLEPDEKYSYKYLEALKEAVDDREN